MTEESQSLRQIRAATTGIRLSSPVPSHTREICAQSATRPTLAFCPSPAAVESPDMRTSSYFNKVSQKVSHFLSLGGSHSSRERPFEAPAAAAAAYRNATRPRASGISTSKTTGKMTDSTAGSQTSGPLGWLIP